MWHVAPYTTDALSSRILSHRIRTHTVPCSSQSSLVPTRQRYRLQQVIKNFTQSTCRLGTSTTTCDVHTVMRSFQSRSFPFRKVSSFTTFYTRSGSNHVLACRQFMRDNGYKIFRKQLYHSSLAHILEPLRPGMTEPVSLHCPDGLFRRAIFSLGPFIADYPEQVFLAGIVYGWCPKSVFH